MFHAARHAFTLIEVMISMAIFVMAFVGLFLTYGQAVRMLDGLRQTSRAEDLLMANMEFLRTRAWADITNVVDTSGGSVSANSSNLVESVSATSSSSPVCNHLQMLSSDPLRIGLKNATRDLQFAPYPGVTAGEPMRRMTVSICWDTFQGRRLTNSMTMYVTKGGLSADVL